MRRLLLILTVLTASVCTAQGASVTVEWVDNSNNEAGFEVWRKSTAAPTWVSVVKTLENVRTYIDSPPEPGFYTYRVQGFNDAGPSLFSNEASIDVAPLPLPPVDCVLSAWGAWGGWVHVGAETTESRTRSRTVITPAANGGAACGPLTEQETRAWVPPPPAPAAPVLSISIARGFPEIFWTPPTTPTVMHVERSFANVTGWGASFDVVGAPGLWADHSISVGSIKWCYRARNHTQTGGDSLRSNTVCTR